MNQRRTVLGGLLALSLIATAVPAAAQSYPSKAITLVVALGPGGAGDIIARRVGQKLSANIGQAVVVENRPGAGAAIAAVMVAKSQPDGYTLLLSGNGSAVSSVLFKSLPYELNRDFRHVSSLASFDLALIVDGQSEFKSVAEIIAYARANPGKLNIGTARIGSTQHLAAELFKSMAGVEATIVPYKSSSEMITALRSRDVQLAFEIIPPILGQIAAKSIRPLGIASNKRFPGLPDLPTVAESGLPGFEATSWAGISVPIKTPTAVVNRLAKEIEAAVNSPDVQAYLQSMGYVARSDTPEQMTQRIHEDMVKWKAVIEKAAIPRQ